MDVAWAFLQTHAFLQTNTKTEKSHFCLLQLHPLTLPADFAPSDLSCCRRESSGPSGCSGLGAAAYACLLGDAGQEGLLCVLCTIPSLQGSPRRMTDITLSEFGLASTLPSLLIPTVPLEA